MARAEALTGIWQAQRAPGNKENPKGLVVVMHSTQFGTSYFPLHEIPRGVKYMRTGQFIKDFFHVPANELRR